MDLGPGPGAGDHLRPHARRISQRYGNSRFHVFARLCGVCQPKQVLGLGLRSWSFDLGRRPKTRDLSRQDLDLLASTYLWLLLLESTMITLSPCVPAYNA